MPKEDELGSAPTQVGATAPTDAAVGQAVSTSPPPQVIADRYEILGLLGAGGMGRVYRAHDRTLNEPGDHDRAMEAIEESVSAALQDHQWMTHCPMLAPLRSRPRFVELAAIVAARAAAVLAA